MSKKNGESVPVRVGLRIKELRAKCGLSQENLAMLAYLDRTYINSVENGRRNISINSLAKISTALGQTLQDFLIKKYELNQSIEFHIELSTLRFDRKTLVFASYL